MIHEHTSMVVSPPRLLVALVVIHAGSTLPWRSFSVLCTGAPLSFQCSGRLSGSATSSGTKGHTAVYN